METENIEVDIVDAVGQQEDCENIELIEPKDTSELPHDVQIAKMKNSMQ